MPEASTKLQRSRVEESSPDQAREHRRERALNRLFARRRDRAAQMVRLAAHTKCSVVVPAGFELAFQFDYGFAIFCMSFEDFLQVRKGQD